MNDPWSVHDVTGGKAPSKAPVKGDFFANLVAHQHGEPASVKSTAKQPAPKAPLAGGRGRGPTYGVQGRVTTQLHPLRFLENLLSGGPQRYYTDPNGNRHPIQGGTVLNPLTLGLSALLQAPQTIESAHRQAVQLAHPSAANPPSLGREVRGLIGGAFGLPFMAVGKDGKPVASTQKIVPTAKTLGETATEALTGAKGVRRTQEALRSNERGARAREYAKALQENPTVQGHQEAKQLLSGALPKLRFAGFEEFSPEALDAMVRHVADHPDLMPFQKTRTIDALSKIHAGSVPTKGEEKLLRQVFGPSTTSELVQSVSGFRRLKALGYDVANIPRSVMASFDVSGILRQALLIGTGNPGIWARNIPSYLKALKSEDVYNQGMQALHTRANAVNGVYDKMGVDLTELAPRGSAVAREEAFRSPLAEKIPGVRMSARGFTLFLDNARADLADRLYAKAVAQGRGNDPKLLESIGSVVNSASGRGDLGEGVIGRSQEGLNLLLFSPRLIKSRVDFINPAWYAKLDPLARHQAYKAMGGLAVLMSTVLGISRAAGAKVNFDPRSSDFAKVKVGNTRLDFAGGFQQYMRLLSELATQQVVNQQGQTTKLGREGPGKTSDWDVAFRFLRSKLSPIASAGVDLSQRQNAVGQPLTWQNSLLSRVTPLSGQDAVAVGRDAAKSAGTPAGVLAGIAAFGLSAVGGGVQNYQPKKPKGSGDPWNVGGGGPGANPWGVTP